MTSFEKTLALGKVGEGRAALLDKRKADKQAKIGQALYQDKNE